MDVYSTELSVGMFQVQLAKGKREITNSQKNRSELLMNEKKGESSFHLFSYHYKTTTYVKYIQCVYSDVVCNLPRQYEQREEDY